MFRIWGKIWKDNHLVRDMVSCNNDYSMSRTAMVFQALDEICHEFDLSQPIWLDSNIRDFQLHDKTRFTKDSFIESIDFDYQEFQVNEEKAPVHAPCRQKPERKQLTYSLQNHCASSRSVYLSWRLDSH